MSRKTSKPAKPDKRKDPPPPSTFLHKAKEDEGMAMVYALKMTLDVVSNYVLFVNEVMDPLLKGDGKCSERTDRSTCYTMKELLNQFEKFYEDWFSYFMVKFKQEVDMIAGPGDDEVDARRWHDLENDFLPKVRKFMLAKGVQIPRTLYNLPEDVAFINFGIAFFGNEYSHRYWTPNKFGENCIWSPDDDPFQWRMFLTSEEPFYGLQVFKNKNVMISGLPAEFGGTTITNVNAEHLTRLMEWKSKWDRATERYRELFPSPLEPPPPVKYPKKAKYMESKHKFGEKDKHYMKCPGCEYIVKLKQMTGIVKLKPYQDLRNIWVDGINGLSRLDLDDIEFDSNFKSKWPYKSMQSHVTKCEFARQAGVPPCFGKPRKPRM